MNATTKALTATAAAVLTALALAGCSQGTVTGTPTAGTTAQASQAPTGAASSDPDQAVTPSTAPPQASTPSVAAGTVLTAAQAASLPKGTAAYKMADGSLVAVTQADPVPTAVVADVQAVAHTTWPKGPVTTNDEDGQSHIDQQNAITTWMHAVGASLGGRNVIVVTKTDTVLGPLAPNETQSGGHPWWVLSNSQTSATYYDTQAEAEAAAQQKATSLAPAVVVDLIY